MVIIEKEGDLVQLWIIEMKNEENIHEYVGVGIIHEQDYMGMLRIIREFFHEMGFS